MSRQEGDILAELYGCVVSLDRQGAVRGGMEQVSADLDRWGGVEGDKRASLLRAITGSENPNLVEAVGGIDWEKRPSDNVLAFLAVLKRIDEGAVARLAEASKKFGDRGMVDKKLGAKLAEAGIEFGVDPGLIKLAISVLRKLNPDGSINHDKLEELKASFEIRAKYWELKEVEMGPADVKPGSQKWNPSPVSVEMSKKFVRTYLVGGSQL